MKEIIQPTPANQQPEQPIPAEAYHVVSHTHWDREWYLPFESFRLRLVDLIDNLLEIFERDSDYIFHLDAQAICLEDYLEIRPFQRERLADLIQSGRLLVGPWYVQNDFHLTSGESTIRNLLIGSEIARDFGHCDKIGYAPDQFGLIGQLPQILNGFGITNTVFGRGFSFYEQDDEGAYARISAPSEFEWVSPDGSSVLAIHLCRWYNNAQRFSEDPEKAKRYLKHIEDSMSDFCTTPFRLLMNGVDHLEPQGNLLPILKQLQGNLGGSATIRQSTLGTYINEVAKYLEDKAPPKVHGELRQGTDLDILQGTLSSRPYLKELNSHCQTLFESELEPLYTMLSRSTEGKVAYPADMMRYLWKELLKNHPHDSICGCSVDRVHQDNENRFLRILDAGNDLKARGIKQLLDRIERSGFSESDYLLAVINPLPYARNEVVTAKVRLPIDEKIDGFALYTHQGKAIEFEILDTVIHNRMTLSPQNLPGQIAVEELTIRFYAEGVPANGHCVYRLSPEVEATRPTSNTALDTPTIENDAYEIHVSPDGSILLKDKRTDFEIPSLLSFEDTADLGDSYVCVPGTSTDLSGFKPKVTVLEKGPLQQSLQLDYAFELPEKLGADKKTRIGKSTTDISITLSLSKGTSLVQIKGTVNNRTQDHRLRLLVHTMIDAEDCTAAQPFDSVRRPRLTFEKGRTEDLAQPVSGWVSVRKNDDQFALMTQGVYDYEYLDDKLKSLAITLVRSTGRIANDPFCEDNGTAPAPEWSAPENQCLRTRSFNVALKLGVSTNAQLFREQQCWASPLLTGFDSTDPHKFMTGRPCVQSADLDERFFDTLPENEVSLPRYQSGIELSEDAVFSAIKQSENREGSILRLFNPESDPSLTATKGFARWRKLNLDETASSEWHSGSYDEPTPPKQIITLLID